MWQDWVCGILGVWAIVVPFLNLSDGGLKWVLVVTGAIIAILGFWAAATRANKPAKKTK